jgi:hypothetical protein
MISDDGKCCLNPDCDYYVQHGIVPLNELKRIEGLQCANCGTPCATCQRRC